MGLTQAGRDGTRARLTTLGAMFVGALTLRSHITGIAPLVPAIQDDLGVSHAVAGLLSTIPVLCFGLMAPIGAGLAVRLGSRTAVALGMGLLAAFAVARAVVPSTPALLVLTLGVGIGLGLANAVMPIAVKQHFSSRPAFATGVYATGINVGATVASAIAVPVAQIAWGWRLSLLVLAVGSVISGVAWLLGMPPDTVRDRAAPLVPRLPVRSPLVWLLVLQVGMLGTVFYGLASWLPDSYGERGWSEESAALLVVVLGFALIPSGLAIGWIADRWGSRRLWLTTSMGMLLAGTVFVVADTDLAWPGVVLAGLGDGALFSLIVTLPLDMAATPAAVGSVVALMLGGGYTIAALTPFVLGAVRDATGSFTASFWVIVGVAVVLNASLLLLTRERLRGALGPRP